VSPLQYKMTYVASGTLQLSRVTWVLFCCEAGRLFGWNIAVVRQIITGHHI